MATTEVTQTSWFSRIGNSISGVFIGIALIIGAIILLFWNEKRTVDTAVGLKEGASVVVEAAAEAVDSAKEGKLVHVTGQAVTSTPLTDTYSGISVSALRLKRTVEVYQWEETSKSETKDKLGGGQETTTTYDYTKKWSENLIDSSSFKESSSHVNPTTKPVESKDWTATDVTVGKYRVSEKFISSLSAYEDFEFPQNFISFLPQAMQQSTKVVGNTMYLNVLEPNTPEVGATRVTYSIIKPQPVSIVAVQRGSEFDAYITKNNQSIQMIETGTHTAPEMFKSAQEGNTVLSWILRAVGILLIYVGFRMILGVLPAIAMVVPFLGRFIDFGMSLLAFVLTLVVSLVVIALAWIVARPMVGIGLLVVVVAAIVFLHKRSGSAKTS